MRNAISLFSGMGALDFGLEAAGFATRFALDSNAECRAALIANRGWVVPECADVHRWNGGQIRKESGLGRGEVSLLAGGPPCQPFSKASYWRTGDSPGVLDPRAGCVEAFIRIVGELLPEAVLFENVPGFAFKRKDESLRAMLLGFEELNKISNSNYRPVWKVLNAADYGVPQHRRRFFLIAARSGKLFDFPSATFGTKLNPFVSSADAFCALLPSDDSKLKISGKWAGLLRSIPEGENYLWHTERGGGIPLFGWRTRYWNFLLKLSRFLPSWTLQASPGPATGPFHWESRLLAPRELMRIQSIPDEIVIPGSYRSVVRMIGNAVPSLLVEVLAREIRRQLFGDIVGDQCLLKMARTQLRTPSIKLAPVPQEYFAFDPPPPHPGEGRGPGAIRRALAA